MVDQTNSRPEPGEKPSRPRDRGYQPGRLAKFSVVVAACLYFATLYFDATRGADLAQGVFLQLMVPFILVIPAWIVGHLAWFIGGRRQGSGDIGFSAALAAECAALAMRAYLR